MITICSLEASPYQLWQLELLYKTFILYQSGDFIAIAHKQTTDNIQTCCPTYWTRSNYRIINNDQYPPYNKIAGVKEFLINMPLPDDEVIMLIDPDCIFCRELNIEVPERTLIAPFYGYMSLTDEVKTLLNGISNIQEWPAVGIPYLIRKDALLNIIDRWLEICVLLRAKSKNWICEMWAFSTAIQEAKYEVKIKKFVNFVNDDESDPYIIHYCDDLYGNDKPIWSKHKPKPIPQPSKARHTTGAKFLHYIKRLG